MSRSFVCRIVRQAIRSTAGTVAGAACLAGMLASTSAARAQGLFAAPTSTPSTLSTGITPQGVAAADFAHSGFQSLVVATNGDNSINVYLGTGNGRFAAPAQSSTCGGPSVVLAKDVDNDTYPDIVVACPSSNTIQLFLNEGAAAPGTFPLFPNYTETIPDPVAMVVGDFEGNGVLGLAVASGTGGVTYITAVDGSLTSTNFSVPGTLTGITAGDFNHDGHLDLALSDSTGSSNNVHVLFGDGAGNFTGLTSYSAGTNPSAIATADFNHDGNLDLAVTNASSNNVTLLLGSATGTFTAQAGPQPAGLNPIGISVTDVNSDGNPDVIAYDAANPSSKTNPGENAYVVLLGNGTNTNTLQAAQISPLGDTPGVEAAVLDFNRDGKPDLAIAQQASNAVMLLQNNTLPTQLDNGRSYAAYAAQAAGNGNMADSIATGDFNRDGKLDVAVTYLEDNVVRVLQNNGAGGFTLTGTYATGTQPYSAASGDLNGDGAPDLVTVNTSVNSPTGTISVFLNNGNGTFKPAATYTVGRLPYQVAIGDVNGDGYPDLAVTNYGASTVSVLYGSKNGTFTAGPTLTVGSGETNPYGVVIGDFQNNGFSDIAVTAFETNTLYVFPNNGSGAFGAPYTYATGSGPMSLLAGDFNRDGKPDLVVANATGGPAGDTNPQTSGNNVSFFAGNGNGTFKAGVISPNLNFPDSIAAADINGDGILDIVGVAPNFNAVEVTLGAGDGTFGTIQQRAAGQFTAKTQPWALALGDFNNDGKVDIVTANTFNQVNISLPAYMTRYMTEYPPVGGGHPSVDLLYNESGAKIALTSSPASPIPAINTGVTVTATVSHALAGVTPTGSVIFENNFGAPLGTGPYTLNGSGQASYATGPLGSGSYVFTTLYSGDTNYQPTTVSGNPFTITVAGTPVTLTINPISVVYSNTFTANVTVTGTPAGGVPKGAIAIDGAGGTLTPITLVNGSGTGTFTAIANNFKVGQYELYAYYTPAGGSPYQPGTSSDVLLTVTPEPTATALSCTFGLGGTNCTATVTVASTGAPLAGGMVDFTVSGTTGTTQATTNANGQAKFTYGTLIGTFTITATFPQQGNYLSSNASQQGGCILFICAITGPAPHPLTSLTGSGFEENFVAPKTNGNAKENKNVLFTLF